jgi:chemotaxis protein CheC
MAKIDLEQLNDMQYDVLKEIGNIGAGNATTALATMLNIKVDMSVPNVALIPFKDIAAVVGSEEDTVIGILIELEGDVNGMMMFIFDMKSAHHLVNSLMMRDVTTDENAGMDTLTEMDMSALNEIGNIVSGSYLNALAGLTGLKMVCSVPSLTVDMVGALLSVPATEFGKYGDKLLLIQSEFGEDDFVTGYFLLIPELDSYDKILSTLGM